MKTGHSSILVKWVQPILTLALLLWPGSATAASSIVDQLVAAAKSDNLVLIKDLLNRGADVNAIAHNGRTALMEAALFDKMRAARLLLQRGADVSCRGKGGMTPLECATVPCKFTKMNPGPRESFKIQGKTPVLMMLFVPRDVEMASLLIENGAAVNAQDESGETALIGALRCNSPALVKLLLFKGGDVNMADKHGETPLMRAVRGNFGDVSSLLAGKKGESFTDTTSLSLK